MEAENARLKAEVDRLKLDYYENKTGEVSATVVQTFNTETGEADYVVSLDDYKKMADMFNAEFLRLKAEVERLTDKIRVSDNHAQCLEFVINSGTANELRLQAQVERLTKAGDAVCESPYLLESDPAVIAWRAAKEGKQP